MIYLEIDTSHGYHIKTKVYGLVRQTSATNTAGNLPYIAHTKELTNLLTKGNSRDLPRATENELSTVRALSSTVALAIQRRFASYR